MRRIRIRVRVTVKSGSVLNSSNNSVAGVKIRIPMKLISVPLNCLEAHAAILSKMFVSLRETVTTWLDPVAKGEAQPMKREEVPELL